MKHEIFEIAQFKTNHSDEVARNALIVEHSVLVRRIAWHVHGRMSQAIEVEDLIQIGLLALVEAWRGFEDRGIDFKHYASVRIRGAMIDTLRREARISRSNMVNRRKLVAARRKLENDLGRPARDDEMAESLSLEISEYYNLVSGTVAECVDSLDEVYSDHASWFADEADDAETIVEKSQLSSQLAGNINRLAEREALILQLYFVEEMNLEEIGATMSIGAARVCQIKKAALKKLRSMMME